MTSNLAYLAWLVMLSAMLFLSLVECQPKALDLCVGNDWNLTSEILVMMGALNSDSGGG